MMQWLFQIVPELILHYFLLLELHFIMVFEFIIKQLSGKIYVMLIKIHYIGDESCQASSTLPS